MFTILSIEFYKAIKELRKYKDIMLNDNDEEATKISNYILSLKGYSRYNFNDPEKHFELSSAYESYKTRLDSVGLFYFSYDDGVFVYTSWIETLCHDFAKFIRFAEKCFMYDNSENNTLYVEDKDDVTRIFFIFPTYKARISYTKSKISNNESPLESFLNDTDNLSVTIYDIEIIRNTGKQMKNTFRFIDEEEPKIKDISDAILIDKLKEDTTEMIIDKFERIMKSIIETEFHNHDIYKDCGFEELLENGLWVR
jgi:hypothetical protein